MEEKGVDTLFVAIGLATWAVDKGAPPNSPVILLPVSATPVDPSRRDFKLELSGDPEVNPILKHSLQTEYRIDVSDEEEALPGADALSLVKLKQWLARVEDRLSRLQDLRIDTRVVIGNFSFTNMPMVQDLRENLPTFAENDFVSTLALVPEAIQSLRSRISDPLPNQPDLDPPQAEFLILDADSSQHRAINRVLAGESLVIWGPPGTGKSQTIGNLIAVLMANGKRVLFVAEKQAAIQVVAKRLEQAGLSEFVMNIHGGVKSKGEFATHMATAMRAITSVPEQDYSTIHSPLVERRETLIEHADMMHSRDERWGLTPFEVQSKLISIAESNPTSVQVASDEVVKLDQRSVDGLMQALGQWGALEAHQLPSWVRESVATPDEAHTVFTLSQRLTDAITEAKPALIAALDEVGLTYPKTFDGWVNAIDFLASVGLLLERYDHAMYTLDHTKLLKELAPATSFLGRALANFSPSYRQARSTVSATLRAPSNLPPQEARQVVQQAIEHVERWGRLGDGSGGPRVPSNLAALEATVGRVSSQMVELNRLFPSIDLLLETSEIIEATLNRLQSQEVAARLPRIHDLEIKLNDAGFGPVMAAICDGVLPVESAPGSLECSWLQAMWADMSFRLPGLAAFTAAGHDQQQADFSKLDRQHLKVTAARGKRSIAEAAIRTINEHSEEEALVRSEAAKKRRQLPVRRLVQQAPNVLTAIHPCWMMSPLLVAEIIPARLSMFDVVIFDEASQIPPAEAIGSLARAPQAVIAGDDRQLPPTSFFNSKLVSDDESTDSEELELALADYESILDVAKAGPIREQMLEWHYRSKDGRLIQFSNTHIYGDALTAFPSIDAECPVAHHLVSATPVQSKSHVSHPDEVQFVVDLVIRHATERPQDSLGVIAFGDRHANNIDEAVRRRLRDLNDHTLDEFFSETADERFFVKNIERVQGDEREVIVLSIGYHKDVKGELPLRFGPLNQAGGERRLNVAVTRARSQVHLVSCFSHHDIDPRKSSARGVELLRLYLAFAASSGTEIGSSLSNVPLNAFELDVRDRLTEKGIPVTPQYGVSGFRIDFACAHPDQPGRMVLAIEADGASYHSAHTARDRDRLRQQVLEDKGWRFHRIWSTEWFRDRDNEVERAVEAWKRACNNADRGDPAPARDIGAEEKPTEARLPDLTASRGPRPRISRGLPIAEYTQADLVTLAQWILSDTLLRTDADMLSEMMQELGFGRRGRRIVEAIEEAVSIASRQNGRAKRQATS